MRVWDINLADFQKIIKANPKKEFILWGMEPTENPDILKIISYLKKKRKQVYLFFKNMFQMK